ncbi:hypothetical protein ACROYT_G014772 [Oculina patagonica]
MAVADYQSSNPGLILQLMEKSLPQLVRLFSRPKQISDERLMEASGSLTTFYLSPSTPEEEEKQLYMAKKLSLSSLSSDASNGDHTEQTHEAANILLSFKSAKE